MHSWCIAHCSNRVAVTRQRRRQGGKEREMPIDIREYPDGWPQITYFLKEFHGWRCEWCGAEHGAEQINASGEPYRVVLSCAHLNHDVANPQASLAVTIALFTSPTCGRRSCAVSCWRNWRRASSCLSKKRCQTGPAVRGLLRTPPEKIQKDL